MKILLSPAKLMQLGNISGVPEMSCPHFIKETRLLVREIRKLSVQEVMKCMEISSAIAKLNVARFQHWNTSEIITDQVQPCSFMFNGEAFKALNVRSLNEDDLAFAQSHLRILSGLYGVLKPLDLIFPYRLEMGTRWSPHQNGKHLYDFWRKKITDYFLEILEENEAVVNLASSEYAKVLDWKSIPYPVITPVFKEFKGGKFKTVMLYAKHARGAMTRYIIQKKVNDVNELKAYGVDGYFYDEKLSSQREWVFVR